MVCGVIAHCDFGLHFPNVEHLFTCLLAVAALSWRKVYLSSLPIWESSCLFFVVDLEFFIILDTNLLLDLQI